MIEVCFSDSGAGALLQAQKITHELGEVVCLAFLLDIGRLDQPVCSDYRRDLIEDLYFKDQLGKEFESDHDGSWIGKEISRLYKFIEEGETIRIWRSDAPFAKCGFMWLCSILTECNNKACVVKLPRYKPNGKAVISYSTWGEIEPHDFLGFLEREKELERIEIVSQAAEWDKLVKENATLRAVINDRTISVDDGFYDFLIWREITNRPIMQAKLIGKLLTDYQIGVGDYWFAQRIQHYIDEGKIIIIEDNEKKYMRLISLGDNQVRI